MPGAGLILGVPLGIWLAKEIEWRLELKYEAEHPEPPKSVAPVKKPVEFSLDQRSFSTSSRISSYRETVLARDTFTCQTCGCREHPSELEVHHVLPRSSGGEDFLTNLVTLCIDCHNNEKWFGHVRVYQRRTSRR